MVRIVFAADHAGFSLKERVKACVSGEIVDVSPVLVEQDDYPLVAESAAKVVVASPGSIGVFFCGSGIGICIAANKVRGVRAATCRSVEDAFLARQDNDANVLCLGGRVTDADSACAIVSAFLKTSFAGATPEGARHARRVRQISGLERS